MLSVLLIGLVAFLGWRWWNGTRATDEKASIDHNSPVLEGAVEARRERCNPALRAGKIGRRTILPATGEVAR